MMLSVLLVLFFFAIGNAVLKCCTYSVSERTLFPYNLVFDPIVVIKNNYQYTNADIVRKQNIVHIFN